MKIDNEFTVTSLNIETFDYPKAKVTVWSNAFSKGGSVNVEAKTADGTRITLYKEDIEEDRNVSDERDYAQGLADDWNEDLVYNWNQELLRCFEKVTAYQQKKVDEFDKEVETLERYKESLATLKEKEETT